MNHKQKLPALGWVNNKTKGAILFPTIRSLCSLTAPFTHSWLPANFNTHQNQQNSKTDKHSWLNVKV